MKNIDSSPRVTIFVPVFNAEDFLHETILSALNQSFKDFELLVIDDGSTDDSIDILESFNDPRLRIVKNESNRGRPYTRNRGVELAKGEFLAVMDADDLSEPDRIMCQVEFLDKHKDITAVGSSATIIDEQGNTASLCKVLTDSDEIHRRIFEVNCFVHSSVMFRRQAIVDIGAYDPTFPQAQDYDLFLRLSEHHKLTNIAKPLVKYRIHSNQVSQTKLASQRHLADKARLRAYNLQKDNGSLPEDVVVPIFTLKHKLRGWGSTLGADYLSWVRLYRNLGQHKTANKFAWLALRAAPLCKACYVQVYREVLIRFFIKN